MAFDAVCRAQVLTPGRIDDHVLCVGPSIATRQYGHTSLRMVCGSKRESSSGAPDSEVTEGVDWRCGEVTDTGGAGAPRLCLQVVPVVRRAQRQRVRGSLC